MVKFPTFIVGRRAIQSPVYWSNVIDFSAVDCSLLVSMSMTAARNYAFFFTFVLNKNNDKYFFFLFEILCWRLLGLNVGRHWWPPKRQPTLTADNVSRGLMSEYLHVSTVCLVCCGDHADGRLYVRVCVWSSMMTRWLICWLNNLTSRTNTSVRWDDCVDHLYWMMRKIRALKQGRSDGGYIGIYTPKSVTVLFTCGTLTHVLKLQWLVETYNTPKSNSWLCHCT